MKTRYHVGAKGLSSGLASYAKRFDLLEVHLDGKEAPSEATMRRWRRDVPPHFEFVVVGAAGLSAMKPGAALDAAIEGAKRAVVALQARTLLISTGTEFTPAAVWRDRMASVLGKLDRDATQIVWEPHGLWEVEDATRAAKRWDVVLCVDAVRDAVPPGAVAYTRLPALGAARSYSETSLRKVVEAIGERREAYVVIETSSALKECKTLRRLSQGPEKRSGGGAMVLRPRTPMLRVRDDEQE